VQTRKPPASGDRIKFDVVDCTRLPAAQFDFISTFDVVHDSVDPDALLKSIRAALKPDGTFLMVEVKRVVESRGQHQSDGPA